MMTLKAGDHVVVSDDVYGGNKKNERVKNSVKKTAFVLSKNVSYQEKKHEWWNKVKSLWKGDELG